MTRAYVRKDPGLFERKVIRQGYGLAAYAAFEACLCLGAGQPEPGHFRDERLLRALLGPAARGIAELKNRGDLIVLRDGRVYIDGWTEWQEGDLTVAERMRRIRERRGEPGPVSGAQRTANWRLRTKVFERDQHTCRYCGRSDYPREWLILEHVDPNGPTDEANLVTACRGCNKEKGGRTPDQAGMTLRAVPVTRHEKKGRDDPPSVGDASPTPAPWLDGDESHEAVTRHRDDLTQSDGGRLRDSGNRTEAGQGQQTEAGQQPRFSDRVPRPPSSRVPARAGGPA